VHLASNVSAGRPDDLAGTSLAPNVLLNDSKPMLGLHGTIVAFRYANSRHP